ncbi:flagellar basal-body rod protein FlgF [Sporomusa acidovorans]|uniref:Flagellar basal-body rod protein FlgG n=1 Tax=Sporomusa acidovorans (strain ATCC 49682 / DSM 3132 / Mol) TaxID=1123286 RepID=A0ABZ3J7B1_SPOA4|nr:flagellar basal-body rod protein FlgF [Sporomusa acidovorans]OZC19267.1 flagellar basal-body rod protein FlgG [Sporomusa acidovorans DSM 3132]SDD82650.1 flagellar basal-body rod protein FlgG [Sporomusa acidovorans]
MIRGIYTAASGMLAETTRADTIANNLANGSTTGYKKDVAISKDFANILIRRINDGGDAPVIGSMGVGTLIDEVATIHTTGSVRTTGNPLDFAIEGRGFFAIQTQAGIRYTRNGSFTRNSRGQLVNSDGQLVLGQNGGPIQLPEGTVTVNGSGIVTVDGTNVGQLQVVEFDNERQLVKEGASLFRAANNGRPATGTVEQGCLEQSNVNVVSEMVNLISGYRAYEVNAKTVQTHDELLDKAVNEVGKV